MADVILVCPECRGKYGHHKGIPMGNRMRWHGSHSHTGGEEIDGRFLDCPICHGKGAQTCEKCGGAGRVVMRDGIQVGVLTRPATSSILGPNPKRIRSS